MSYLESQLEYFVSVSQRQLAKDELMISQLEDYFQKGIILEIGAGCGQLSKILQDRGYEVISSDIQPFFVDYMRKQGLNSLIVDALQVSQSLDQKVDNILTQGVSTLVTSDLLIVKKSYQSVFNFLKKGGRFIFIFPNAYNSKNWSSINDHISVIDDVGFKVIKIFRNQVLPSILYPKIRKKTAKFIEDKIGKHFGIRYVIVLEK